MKINLVPGAVVTFIIIAQSKLNDTENSISTYPHNYNSCKPNTINWCQPHTFNAVNGRSTNSIDVISSFSYGRDAIILPTYIVLLCADTINIIRSPSQH